MPGQATCPGCKHAYEVPANFLGKIVRCPKCRAEFRAPAATTSPDDLPRMRDAYADQSEPRPRRAAATPPLLENESRPRRRDPELLPDRTGKGTWVIIGISVMLLSAVLGVIGVLIMRADRTTASSPTNSTELRQRMGVGTRQELRAIEEAEVIAMDEQERAAMMRQREVEERANAEKRAFELKEFQARALEERVAAETKALALKEALALQQERLRAEMEAMEKAEAEKKAKEAKEKAEKEAKEKAEAEKKAKEEADKKKNEPPTP